MTKITRNLPDNQYQAALAANSPTALNPFATMADTGGGGDPLLRNVTTNATFIPGIPTGNLGTTIQPPPTPGGPPQPPALPPWASTGTLTGTGLTTGQIMTGSISGATADVSVQIVFGIIAVTVNVVNSQTFVIGEEVSIIIENEADRI